MNRKNYEAMLARLEKQEKYEVEQLWKKFMEPVKQYVLDKEHGRKAQWPYWIKKPLRQLQQISQKYGVELFDFDIERRSKRDLVAMTLDCWIEEYKMMHRRLISGNLKIADMKMLRKIARELHVTLEEAIQQTKEYVIGLCHTFQTERANLLAS